MSYRAAVGDIRFILGHILPFSDLFKAERFAELGEDLADSVLDAAGKLCDEVLAPLNRAGDLHPAVLDNGVLKTSPGYAEGFHAIADGGWIGLAAGSEHGGMGLPRVLDQAVGEMMAGAALSLQLNPLLTGGQILALEQHADPEMQALYLPKLISGEWSGTMNLTEAGAGTDVGALRARAEPQPDGTYAITGEKIFISWGDTDFTENVCHLVLARLPDAPAGTKGISLFMVPKFIPDADGKPGVKNSLSVAGLENKLGLHGSPTCVIHYEGAKGWMVGPEHGGMAAMFTMMNVARLGVGMQGVGVAEAALQQAAAFAATREQMGPIIRHADIRRMLATVRAEVFAARALGLDCALAMDRDSAFGNEAARARAAFLTPIAKVYGTETGIRSADMGMQVHGGMGYIEETGAAQYLRDVRITSIYEGTNGIQAMDLVGRKMKDEGAAAFALLAEVQKTARAAKADHPDLAETVRKAANNLRRATETLLEQGLEDRFAGAVPYLMAFSRLLGAHYHLRAALTGDATRVTLARIFVTRVLPRNAGDLAEAMAGVADLDQLDDAAFG